MPHQDKDDLRTPVAELKELLAPIRDARVDVIGRHGNAGWTFPSLIASDSSLFLSRLAGNNHFGDAQ
ncbi:hypothetical protein SAMN06265222_111173 [Neorhodopirellula lusitana]|uniref:Uncharacterized protein n=1 Tax=Neorhodopirellula lusitana TaxID=445327 RepID=A0ABY1QFC9_9BACT|nr:hypothetical protein SAMN06265222_111173 [Neorhodopirellula lusitana]